MRQIIVEIDGYDDNVCGHCDFFEEKIWAAENDGVLWEGIMPICKLFDLELNKSEKCNGFERCNVCKENQLISEVHDANDNLVRKDKMPLVAVDIDCEKKYCGKCQFWNHSLYDLTEQSGDIPCMANKTNVKKDGENYLRCKECLGNELNIKSV